ncbi:MAG TPA: phospholipase D family protein, partial [Sphingorhabdus sp.]|nr:phospholipase D family protein [Sphingorhabdus sp.]
MSALIAPTHDNKAAYKLELIRSQSPWIDDSGLEGDTPFDLSDGSQIDLLLSDPTNANGLADRMLKLVDEPVERLTIISPYWDDQLSALKRLSAAVGDPDLHIFLSHNARNPSRSSTFPVAAIGKLALKFHPIGSGEESSDRFLHAKMFLFHGSDHDFLFIGSANCTVAALGAPGKAGANHECLLYRKLPRGSVKKDLKLSYKSKIAVADIAVPPDKTETASDTTAFMAGAVELRATRLVWTPAPSITGAVASVKVDDVHFPLAQRSDGLWIADIGDVKLGSNIARICLADGGISRPIIIANPEELMRFAPFPVADSIRKKLDAVLNGDADLIGLAKDIHLLLEDDAKIGPALERIRSAGGRSATPAITGRDFATPEEFRKALNLRVSMKSAGLAHGDNPALQALLQIVLRGMVNVETVERLDAEDAAKARGHDAGEDQDDVGQSDDIAVLHVALSNADMEPQIVSGSEFDRNQAALWRGIGKFQDFLERAKDSDEALDLNFVTRSLFMLYLMLHGCTKRYKTENGGEAVLIPFTGRAGENFRDSFLFVAAQAIAAVWGPNFARCLVSRLKFTADGDTLPIQITTLTIISRWVLAAILSEVRGAKAHKSLRDILEKQVPNLFAATKVFPDLSQEELLATIMQMEANMGMDVEQGARIRETLGELGRDMTLG